MIELKTYTTKELCEALNIKITSFKTHKERALKDYKYIEAKAGRNKAYTILAYKGKEKSTFIQLCEKITETEVKFPKEQTAISILEVLFKKDCTILDNEELGYETSKNFERHTIGRYINLFRTYKILPPILPKVPRLVLDKETGEFISKEYDPNEYVYYSVSRNIEFREEITKDEYFEMIRFIHKIRSEYLNDFLQVLDSQEYSQKEIEEVIEEYKRESNRIAFIECKKEFTGVPMKAISKVPTKEAFDVLYSYFNLKAA